MSEETNTKFVAKIKAVPTILHSSKATLCFENKDESIEAFHTVTKDYKKLKNINWFKVFIEDTKKMGDSLLYTNIVDAPSDVVDNEYVMPVTLDKTIQKALTNYINNFNMIEYASTIQPPIQGNKTEINK